MQRDIHASFQERRAWRSWNLTQPMESSKQVSLIDEKTRIVELAAKVAADCRTAIEVTSRCAITLNNPAIFIKAAEKVDRLDMAKISSILQP
ncbi:MAG TPA: hypothetical protein VL346_00320, partial [Acidobacteriaceae bacterium]|nr:hypothetical protein [Acidobacteriaceae bacterium]